MLQTLLGGKKNGRNRRKEKAEKGIGKRVIKNRKKKFIYLLIVFKRKRFEKA